MRPEVRAEYERALGRIAGDTAFAIRLERFFTELRDPLVAVYGADARFPAQWAALLDTVAQAAAARARRRLPAPHAAAARPAAAQRRRLRGHRLRRRRARARDDGRPARAGRGAARRRHGAVRRRGAQP